MQNVFRSIGNVTALPLFQNDLLICLTTDIVLVDYTGIKIYPSSGLKYTND